MFKEEQRYPSRYTVRPDLGGTRGDFAVEISSDRLVFELRDKGFLNKLTIPSELSFLKLSRSKGESGDFLEAYYDRWGDLRSARIWFRRFVKQPGFIHALKPTRDFMDAYYFLKETGTDLILAANIPDMNSFLIHGEDKSLGENIVMIAHDKRPLEVDKNVLITFTADSADPVIPVKFAMGLIDNVLTLGICPDEEKVVLEQVSTGIGDIKLGSYSTPEEVEKLLDKILVTS